MHKLLDRLPLNTDVEAEFHYWTGQLRGAVVTALVVAVACGAAITLLPGRAEDPDGYGFMKAHWPHLLEVAFWFGLLVGLVWSAAKRLGGALAGSLPWKPEADCCEQESSARLFGGWGEGSRVGKPTEWSYPGAIEHDGKLYVAYTQGKEDCALSIIPLSALAV